jgi:hypothetical protein
MGLRYGHIQQRKKERACSRKFVIRTTGRVWNIAVISVIAPAYTNPPKALLRPSWNVIPAGNMYVAGIE